MDYLSLDNSVSKNEEKCFSQYRCSYCGGLYPTEKYFKQQRKEKGYKKPPFTSRNTNNKYNERNCRKPNTCFRCGSEDSFIANCSK